MPIPGLRVVAKWPEILASHKSGTALAEASKNAHCTMPVNPSRPSRLRALVGDPHFWIPVAVLVLGLLVLRWIA